MDTYCTEYKGSGDERNGFEVARKLDTTSCLVQEPCFVKDIRDDLVLRITAKCLRVLGTHNYQPKQGTTKEYEYGTL